MIGVELVRDHKELTPANDETAYIMERSKEMGVLFGKGGLYGNCLRIKPPMCINKKDVDFAVEVLDVCLDEVKAGKKL
jgi:alanine-glyoxylate transaminase/(R)-3-amino-2-methylpropionate-pyruvate transaminase